MTSFFYSYLNSLLTISFCAFICEVISGASKSQSMQRALSLISSLCIFLSILIPFSSKLIDLLNNFKIQSNNFYSQQERQNLTQSNSYVRQLKVELENKVKSNIFKETGILPQDVCIDLSEESDSESLIINIKNIKITFSEISSEKEKKVTDLVKQWFDVTATVATSGE